MAYTSKHPQRKEFRDPEVIANMLLKLRDELYDEIKDRSVFDPKCEIFLKINSCLYVSKREQRAKI